MRSLASLALVLAFGCKSTDYSKPVAVDELVTSADDRVDHDAVVTGFVKPGSIDTKIVYQHTQQTFTLIKAGKEIRVRHTGPVPDTFADEAELQVSGKLVREKGELVVTCDGDGLTVKRHF